VSFVSKSGSLNLLEPSGPAICLYRDCFTFALPFTYTKTPAYTNTHTQEHVRVHTHTKWKKNVRRHFTGWIRHGDINGKCYTTFVRTRLLLSYGFGVNISYRLKKISTCAMAYVYMSFRYRLPVISTLQDYRDQAASKSSTILCGLWRKCRDRSSLPVTRNLLFEICSAVHNFLFGMKWSIRKRNSRFATTIFYRMYYAGRYRWPCGPFRA